MPKLTLPWKGPCVVLESLTYTLYRVKTREKSNPKVVHHNRMEPYKGNNRPKLTLFKDWGAHKLYKF